MRTSVTSYIIQHDTNIRYKLHYKPGYEHPLHVTLYNMMRTSVTSYIINQDTNICYKLHYKPGYEHLLQNTLYKKDTKIRYKQLLKYVYIYLCFTQRWEHFGKGQFNCCCISYFIYNTIRSTSQSLAPFIFGNSLLSSVTAYLDLQHCRNNDIALRRKIRLIAMYKNGLKK